MTPRGAWRRRLWWRCPAFLIIAALAWSPVGGVAAGVPPPAPTGQAQPLTPAPAHPAAGQVVLYDHMDSASGNWVSSQNSTDHQYDSQAADDFFVPAGPNWWHITTVEVAGHYSFGSGSPSVNAVSVAFYADSAGKPGSLLSTANIAPINGTASTGNFDLPLSAPITLPPNATFWVSVQAIQSTSWYWYWSQRTTVPPDTGVWQNPSGVFVGGCKSWTPIETCYPGTGADLLFRLSGNTFQLTHSLFLPLLRR